MIHNSSVNFKLIHFLLWIKEPIKVRISSAQVEIHQILAKVFLQILHQSSVSWDINTLYVFYTEILYPFNKRSLQSTNLVKFHVSSRKSEILHFDPNHIRCQLKKYRRVISHDTNEWGIWWIFALPIKSLKISFRWALFVQSIQSLSYKNIDQLSFMVRNSDANGSKNSMRNWVNVH